MLTSIRGVFTAILISGFALSASPLLANEIAVDEKVDLAPHDAAADVEIDIGEFSPTIEPIHGEAASEIGAASGFEFSGNAALVSEYRFRGVDLSGGDIAVQGGIDIAHDSGFYIGAWGSSLDEDTVGYGRAELDVYAGLGGEFGGGFSFDVGGIAYIYPDAGAGDFNYVEVYGSLGFSIGPVESMLGVAYAPDQASLGDTDNLYIYNDWSLGIPQTPLSVTAHLGYTDGFLTYTDNSKAWDWSIGVEASIFGPVSLGVAYVDAEGDIPAAGYDFVDDAVVFSISASI